MHQIIFELLRRIMKNLVSSTTLIFHLMTKYENFFLKFLTKTQNPLFVLRSGNSKPKFIIFLDIITVDKPISQDFIRSST